VKSPRHFWLVLTAVSLLAAVGIATHLFTGKLIRAAAAQTATESGVATNFVGVAATTPAEADSFRAAVLEALHETDPLRRSLAFAEAFAAWFQHDPESALAWLRRMPRGSEYTQGMFMSLQAICKTDPQRAFALAGEMAVTHEQLVIYNVLLDQLAQNDLSLALDYLRSVPAGEARVNALRAVADGWAGKDPSAALDWAKNLDDAGEHAAMMESILTTLATSDPRRVMDLASANLDGGALDRVLEKSLKQLAVLDPQSAADAVSRLPEGDLQKNSAMAVARSLAEMDPAAAISWQQTLPADSQPVVLNNVLDVWLKQDPATAGQYVAQLSAGPVQDAAVSRFAENWAVKDPAAAIAWAGSLPGGSAQNAAVISIASGWARVDAATATQWAASLPVDNPARAEALKGAYSYWKLADVAAADNYLKTFPVAGQ